jgi:hypothetical protein
LSKRTSSETFRKGIRDDDVIRLPFTDGKTALRRANQLGEHPPEVP